MVPRLVFAFEIPPHYLIYSIIVFQILTSIPGGAESSIPMGPMLPNFAKAFYMPFIYVHQALTG